MIDQADWVIRQKDGTVLVFIQEQDRLLHLVIKTTASRQQLFLSSFRETRQKDIQRTKKRGEILKTKGEG